MTRRQALAAAYQATTYRVFLPGLTVDVRIGQTTPALDAWLVAQSALGWAIITAVNPGSQRLTDGENLSRQQALMQQLQAEGWHAQAVENIADHGAWPMEPAYLIPNFPLAKATQLAALYRQNAFVYGVLGSPAQLVWLTG